MDDFTFTLEPDGTLPLATAVFQALGAASVCWEAPEGAGVFDSERAKAIGDALLARIKEEYPHPSGDFTVLGPECFLGDEIICYRGENYIRA